MPEENSTQSDNHRDDDGKIELAEFIKVFSDRKRLILGGSSICTLIVFLFTFLSPRQYQSEALILVSNSMMKTSNEDGQEPSVSEISVSTLEPSTYEIIAKSDELMLALADTLIEKLPIEKLKKIAEQTDSYQLASELTKTLEIDLYQETGQRNVQSTTPLLAFQYSSTETTLPATVVNIWSDLFLQRNQGLSSNVTDDFYQKVLLQYKQAKYNLEEKENELAKVNAASNRLNQLKTELTFKTGRLETSLKDYQSLLTELEEKRQEYAFVRTTLNSIEIEGRWIGHLDISTIDNETNYLDKELVSLIKNVAELYRDSTLISQDLKEQLTDLKAKHDKVKLNFEQEYNINNKRYIIAQLNSLIDTYSQALVKSESEKELISLEIKSLQQTLDTQDPVLITRKTVSDDLLWDFTKSNRKTDLTDKKRLEKYGLISEGVNPVYLDIDRSLAEANRNLALITEQLNFYPAEINAMKHEVLQQYGELEVLRKAELDLNEQITRDFISYEYEKDRRESAVGLSLNLRRNIFSVYKKQYEEMKMREEQLILDIKKIEMSSSYHKRNYELWRNELSSLSVTVDSLDLERRRIERDTKIYEESFNRLMKLQEEARLARQQAVGDLQIVSRGYLAEPIARNTLLKTASAAVSSIFILLIWVSVQYKMKP